MIFRGAASPAPAEDIPAGHAVDGVLGENSWAITYRATEERMKRPVALRVLRQPAVDADNRRRAEQACQSLGALPAHPALATVYAAGITPGGRPFAAEQFYPGGSAGDQLQTAGPMPVSRAVGVGVRLAEALASAHSAGVVHGGIDPGDVLLTTTGDPALGGFGLEPAVCSVDWRARVDPASLVHLPPEVLEGGEASPAGDVYGLAATLYTLLAGQPAHQAAVAGGLAALIQRQLRADLPAIPRGDVSAKLVDVLRVALDPDPAGRFATATALGAALASAAGDGWDPDADTVSWSARGQSARGQAAAPAPEDARVAARGGFAPGARATPPVPVPGPPAVPDWAASSVPDWAAGPTGGRPDLPPPGGSPGDGGAPRPGGPPGGGDGPKRASGARHALLVIAAALTVAAVVLGVRTGSSSAGKKEGAPPATSPVAASTTVIRPSPATRLEQQDYQPTSLRAVPGQGQVVLSWLLPPDARRDGAGIIIRQEPEPESGGVIPLGRTGGSLAQSHVISGTRAGQEYCFLVGVLLQRATGEPVLVNAGPVCAVAR